jgi:hypothetical protein
MIACLAVLGSLYAIGAIAMYISALNAPEGWEDETGFHVLWRNNDPGRANVVCIWDGQTAPRTSSC